MCALPMRTATRKVVSRQHTVHTSALPKCSRLLVYFGGDQLSPDAAPDLDPEVVRLAQVQHQADLMCRHFPDCGVLAIEPCRLADGYACYDNFLVKSTASGEPLGYTGQGLKAVTLLHDLVKATLGDALGLDSQTAPLPVTWFLVGFSKGTVVLNQILTELAWMAEHCTGEEHQQLQAFLRGLEQVHYVDAGLNCRGAHITDPSTTAALGAGWRTAAGAPLRVALHGTPRQWDDKRRPWIKREMEVFQRLLEQAQVPVVARRYMDKEDPSLLMHFRALEVFDPTCLLPV